MVPAREKVSPPFAHDLPLAHCFVSHIAGVRNTTKEAGTSARGAAMMARIGNTSRANFGTDITNKVYDSQAARSVGPATPEAELDKIRTARHTGSFSVLFVLVIHPVKGRVIPNTYGQMSVLVDPSVTMQGEVAFCDTRTIVNHLDVIQMCSEAWSIAPLKNGLKTVIAIA